MTLHKKDSNDLDHDPIALPSLTPLYEHSLTYISSEQKTKFHDLHQKYITSLLTFLPVPQGEQGIPRPVQRSMKSGHWGQTGQGHCLLKSTISDIFVYRVLPGCHHI